MHSLLLAHKDGGGWGLPCELYHVGVTFDLSDWLKRGWKLGCGDNETLGLRIKFRVQMWGSWGVARKRLQLLLGITIYSR